MAPPLHTGPMLLAAGLLAWPWTSGCLRSGAFLQYTVTVDDPASGRVDVRLAMSGADADTLMLKGYEADEYLRLGELSVTSHTDGRSQALPVSVDTLSVEQGHKTVTLTRRRVQTQRGADSVVVSYSVRPGAEIWLSGEGKAPRQVSGYLAGDFGLVSGRNLFLVPDVSFDSVTVAFRMAEGAGVVTPWGHGSPHQPRVFPETREEDLVNAVLGLGAFDHRHSEDDGNALEVYVYGGWSETRRDSLARATREIYAYVNRLFGARDTGPYSVILTPKTPKGLDIATSASGAGFGMEMEPAMPVRWVLMAASMADRYLRFQPYGMRFYREEDLWFPEGVAFYYGMKAAAEAGVLPDFEQYLRDVYLTYNEGVLTVYELMPYTVGEWRKLAAPRLTELRRAIGVVLTHQLEATIAGESGGQASLAEGLGRLWRKRDVESLPGQLGEAAGVDLGGFLSEFVYADRPREIPYAGEPTFAEVVERVAQGPPKGWEGSGISDTLTLIVTAGAESYLETCGCVASQSGGVARRATAIDLIRRQHRNVLVLDAGDFLPDPLDVPAMDELTAREVVTYVAAMHLMGYDLATVGGHEIYFGPDLLEAATRHAGFALAGAVVRSDGQRLGRAIHLLEASGHRLALAAVYRPRLRLRRDAFTERLEGWAFDDAITSAQQALDLRDRGEADLAGVIGRLRLPDVVRLLDQVSDLDLVLTTGSRAGSSRLVAGQVQQTSGVVEGFLGSTLVLSARSGKYGVQQVDLYLDEGGRIAGFHDLHVDLNEWVRDQAAVRAYLEGFYRQVAEESGLHGGQVEPLFREDPVFEGVGFVGVGECAECHEEQMVHWQGTRHARAYKSLLGAHRHYYPRCVVCHVTGMGRDSGYRIGDGETDKANVGCELCHGPGSAHVESRSVETIRRRPEAAQCTACHQGEHDEDFEYQRKVALVTH